MLSVFRSPLIHAACLTLAVTSVLVVLAPRLVSSDEGSTERRTPVVRAVESAGPAVVNIYTETIVQSRSPFGRGRDPVFGDLFGDFFGRRPQPRQQRRNSLGSGVIVAKEGIVVTNEHVIVRANKVRVQLADHREFNARLIGSDSDADLAVLKLETEEPLPFIPIGENDSVMIGETVIAIGNPFGLSHTVTSGVMSAIGRTFQAGDIVYQDFLQTDASINPGNSGGPLLDVAGRLIGINTAVHREGQGIGFAIPLWRVRNIVEQILDHGSVLPAWIGLSVQSLSPDLALHFGVVSDAGALVRSVEEDSPAALAGIARGDIITHAQGARLSGAGDWQRRASGLSAGDKLRLRLLDGDTTRDVTLDIVSVPAKRIDDFSWLRLGLAVLEKQQPQRVVVAKLRKDSPATSIGFEPGDLIAGVGGVEISSVEDYRKELARHRDRNNILLAVVRGRRLYRVTVPLAR